MENCFFLYHTREIGKSIVIIQFSNDEIYFFSNKLFERKSKPLLF